MKKQTRQNIFIQYLLAFTLVLSGCAQSPKHSEVSHRVDHLTPEPGNNPSTADLIQVAREVLAGMYFTIEKSDTRSGIVRTRPLPGAQFFEFWRSDNIGAENALEANLHTIRRTVIVEISKQGTERSIGCEARVQRLSMPEREVSSITRVYGMFSRSGPSLQRLQLNPEQAQQMTWIDLGRDSQLEAEILKRIETQIKRQQTTETEI